MGTVHQLRPASVSVFATERDDRPIAIQIESRSSTSSALLTVPEAMAVHSMLGQLIRDALPPRERLLAEEREDAARAVAELEHDAWASGAFERALDRHLADLCSAGGEQIHGRGSSRTSEERACPAPGDLSPAESSAEPALEPLQAIRVVGSGGPQPATREIETRRVPAGVTAGVFQTSSDAFAVVAGAAHDLAPALTGGRCSDCVGHDGACGMVSPRLLHTQSRAADGSKSGTPRAGEEG